MNKHWKKLGLAAIAAALVGVTGCEQIGDPIGPDASGVPTRSDYGIGFPNGMETLETESTDTTTTSPGKPSK